MVPERLVECRERVSRWSMDRRKAETRLKLVLRKVELRSMAETRKALQEMPVKAHGSRLGSQSERRFELGRAALKLMSCWVSLPGEEEKEAGDARREVRKAKEMRTRQKRELGRQNGFILDAARY
ncbi:hypothetical protein CIPAW_04G089400 [Carya illinoinensis]|uniref:Uncharacterized protein n=1 Tax=Carya illinoinensis TaxID=32201 RepID=A0A8T1QS99_CARIL|nr:hypothetical protein CIPAW_04G089400 [Carya illinoinensis]